MLTMYQATTVAYFDENGLACRDCVLLNEGLNEVRLAKMEAGLEDWPEGIDPLCRYSLDEMQSEHAYDDPENYPPDNYELWPRECCDQCGRELDH